GHVVASVGHVLEQQQPQDYLGRCPWPPARAALGPAPCECLVDNLHQLGIGEQRIDLAHPPFPQGTYFLLDQALGEGQLRSRGLDQLKSSCASASAWHARAASRAPASSTVARDCPRRSLCRSAETAPTRSARREGPPPALPAHPQSAPDLRICRGHTGTGHAVSPDRE